VKTKDEIFSVSRRMNQVREGLRQYIAIPYGDRLEVYMMGPERCWTNLELNEV